MVKITLIESDATLQEKVVMHIKMVYDPEIPVDVFELGLIYSIDIVKDQVYIVMTLTNPGCPSGSAIVKAVENSLRLIKELKNVIVELTFNPPYSASMMSDVARLELGFM